MPWIFVFNGASLDLKGEQHDVDDFLREKVNDKLETAGLTAQSLVNSDDDLTVVIVGVEMLPGRRISKGVARTMHHASLPDNFDDVFSDVQSTLEEKYGETYNYKKGIIVAPFN